MHRSKGKIDSVFTIREEAKIIAAYSAIFDTSGENITMCVVAENLEILGAKQIVDSMSDYIERGGVISIYINNYGQVDASKSLVLQRLGYYQVIAPGKVCIYSTDMAPVAEIDGKKQNANIAWSDCSSFIIQCGEPNLAICSMSSPVSIVKFNRLMLQIRDKAKNEPIDLAEALNLQVF